MVAKRREIGSSTLSIIASIAIVGVISTVAVANVVAGGDSAGDSALEFAALLREARTRALSSASAYFVIPEGGKRITTSFGTSCQDRSPVSDPLLAVDLLPGVRMADNNWVICFDSKGMANHEVAVTMQDSSSNMRTVQVIEGGSVRLQ